MLEEEIADSSGFDLMEGEDERLSEYINEIRDQVEAPRQNVEDTEIAEREKRSTLRSMYIISTSLFVSDYL